MQKDGTWDKYCQIMTAAVWRGTWQEFIPEAPYFATGAEFHQRKATVSYRYTSGMRSRQAAMV